MADPLHGTPAVSAVGGFAQRTGFHSTGVDMFVDILVNPWTG